VTLHFFKKFVQKSKNYFNFFFNTYQNLTFYIWNMLFYNLMVKIRYYNENKLNLNLIIYHILNYKFIKFNIIQIVFKYKDLYN
jgi:hypothetical protein